MALRALRSTSSLSRMPHVAIHVNRNTFQGWEEITAARWGIGTILS
jgi:hypothetical protein